MFSIRKPLAGDTKGGDCRGVRITTPSGVGGSEPIEIRSAMSESQRTSDDQGINSVIETYCLI